MLFVIHGIDKPNNQIRERLIDKHRKYLDNSPLKILFSGPLVEDDSDKMIGSLIILDAANREEVDELIAREPMNKAGLYESLNITRCYQRKGSFIDMAN